MIGRVCYAYKLSPSEVLSMPQKQVAYLSAHVAEYREEEAAMLAYAVGRMLFGDGKADEDEELERPDTPEALIAALGGG
jgi:hypothetical protein